MSLDRTWREMDGTQPHFRGASSQALSAAEKARREAITDLDDNAEPWLVEATIQLATYKAVADVLDPGRSHRVPEWGDY